jgi:DNA-binding transcriptional LysR family regulator
MELRHIETFMAIAELGSFSAAGSRLHRSPAAVSTHVRQLEAELGVRLLERTTRRVALTDEGRMLQARCRVVMAELGDVSRELMERSALRSGHVSIGTVPSVSNHRLPQALAAFKAQHAGITLELHEGSVSRIHSDLRERVTDFAIAPAFGTDADLIHEPVLSDPLVAVLPRTLAANPRGITLAELARHDLLAHPADTAVRAAVEHAFRAAGLRFQPSIEVGHHQTLLNMVAAGLGVTVLPSICLPPQRTRAYTVVPLHGVTHSREICIVTLRGRSLSGAAAACSALLVDALRKRSGVTRHQVPRPSDPPQPAGAAQPARPRGSRTQAPQAGATSLPRQAPREPRLSAAAPSAAPSAAPASRSPRSPRPGRSAPR